jgi:hypothetical protein
MLIESKIEGFTTARGDVLVFIDAHSWGYAVGIAPEWEDEITRRKFVDYSIDEIMESLREEYAIA